MFGHHCPTIFSQALLDNNYNIATLLSMYNTDTDWRDPSTWSCNNNVHASRHGTWGGLIWRTHDITHKFIGGHHHAIGSYDGIDMHPFETLFVKSSWHVVCVNEYTWLYAGKHIHARRPFLCPG